MPNAQTSSRYVAFLRGVNVGGRVIKNADLEACFKEMGFADVRVVIQSGNVLFSAARTPVLKLVGTIQAALTKRFDYPAKVMVVGIKELEAIAKAYPFDSSIATDQHYVLFLGRDVGEEMVKAAPLDKTIEKLAAGKQVIYWTVPKGQTLHTPFAKFLTKAPYRDIHTNRNLNTLRKILAIG